MLLMLLKSLTLLFSNVQNSQADGSTVQLWIALYPNYIFIFFVQ